ncbi:unnamed protein product [Discula destructiva]
MRLLNRLALAGLAGLASAATSDPAEVYILSKSSTSSSSSSTPQLPRHLAKQIFVQRLGGDINFSDLESTYDIDDAVSHITQYGKAPKPLFGDAASAADVAPSQLLIVFEGVTEENSKELRRQLKDQSSSPAFTVADAPSAQANARLIDVELSGFSKSCDMAAAINPYDSCWDGVLAVKSDLKHNHAALQTLVDNFHVLRQHIATSDLEATLVLLPESTRTSSHDTWAASSMLQRRGAEAVLSEPQSKVVVLPSDALASTSPVTRMNLGCFATFNSCVTSTANCTGHGYCVDKYARSDGQESDRQCFVCHCQSTLSYPDKEDTQLTSWGGAYCQKIDISSPFWLLVGTSVLLIGIVTGCIGLLFSVGEEKLPGVIGAGVSRSK